MTDETTNTPDAAKDRRWVVRCPLCGWPEGFHVPISRCPAAMMRLAQHFNLLEEDA